MRLEYPISEYTLVSVIGKSSVPLLIGGLGYPVSKYRSVSVIARVQFNSLEGDSDIVCPSVAQLP